MKVFVYGSLKRGFYNHEVLTEQRAKFIGETSIESGQFAMLDLGSFPALFENVDGPEIFGELFEVENLDRLDQLEGYPRFYNRREVSLTCGNRAIVYFLDSDSLFGARGLVSDGRWTERRVHVL